MVAKTKANLYDSRCPIRRIAESDFRSLISWLYCEHGAQWRQKLFFETLFSFSVLGYDYEMVKHTASLGQLSTTPPESLIGYEN